ncbi:hypothetical protein [Leptodesmis sp.]|uniref:hypothetical protein n=1 Tax=Leptodesmis sp. TaxID=3100501 RepID=UPI0040534B31
MSANQELFVSLVDDASQTTPKPGNPHLPLSAIVSSHLKLLTLHQIGKLLKSFSCATACDVDQLLTQLTLEVIASITEYSFILDALSALNPI